MIDSHCHLDQFARSDELEAVLKRAEEAGVEKMVTMGTSIKDWALYAKIAAEHPGVVYWAAGLHPTEIEDGWEDQIAALTSWFATPPQPVAIGEIGLDFFHLPKDPAKATAIVTRQKAVLHAQLEIALQLDCPVVIHARNAFADTLNMIDASGIDWRKVVFHCFSEGPEEIRELNNKGGRASFTGTITYRNATNVLAAALAQGIDRLMLETDCPYLTPEPMRGKRNEPALLQLTAKWISDKMKLPLSVIDRTATENAERFFSMA